MNNLVDSAMTKYEDLKTDEDKAIYIKNLPKEYGNNITVTGHSNLILL